MPNFCQNAMSMILLWPLSTGVYTRLPCTPARPLLSHALARSFPSRLRVHCHAGYAHIRARGWTCRKPCTVRGCPERGLGGVYAPTLRVLAQCFTSTSAVLLPSRRALPALSSRRQSHFLSLSASPRQLEPTFHYTRLAYGLIYVNKYVKWLENISISKETITVFIFKILLINEGIARDA